MTHKIALKLNEHEYLVEVTFKRKLELLNQFPTNIAEMISNNQYYIVDSKIKKETFDSFVKYLEDCIEPEINLENMHDFYLLSQEFQVLREYLSNKIDEDKMKLSILTNDTNTDKASIEKHVSMHLDDFIVKFKEEMQQVPINSLFNIFYHKERILNDHQKAYEFIIELSSILLSSNYFILLQSLDGEKLTEASQTESLVKKEERFGYAPSFNSAYFEKMINNVKSPANSLIDVTLKLEKGVLHKFKKQFSIGQ